MRWTRSTGMGANASTMTAKAHGSERGKRSTAKEERVSATDHIPSAPSRSSTTPNDDCKERIMAAAMPARWLFRKRRGLIGKECPFPLADSCGEAYMRPTSRSEEHTSELQSLMRISYAVFCLKKKNFFFFFLFFFTFFFFYYFLFFSLFFFFSFILFFFFFSSLS